MLQEEAYRVDQICNTDHVSPIESKEADMIRQHYCDPRPLCGHFRSISVDDACDDHKGNRERERDEAVLGLEDSFAEFTHRLDSQIRAVPKQGYYQCCGDDLRYLHDAKLLVREEIGRRSKNLRES